MNISEAITRRTALVGAAVSSVALAAPVSAAFIEQPIDALLPLYREWLSYREGYEGMSEAESHARYLVYVDLQARITAATPVTARDVAIQLVVETDMGESEWRDTFFERLAALAGA